MNELKLNHIHTIASFFEKNAVPMPDYQSVFFLFYPEIANYCELVRGFQDESCGLVFCGEKPDFNTRLMQLLDIWETPQEHKIYFEQLARQFERQKRFLKFEWSRGCEDPAALPSCSCYFRRRPQVNEMILYYNNWGVSKSILECLAGFAAILEKDSIHFVAASFSPNKNPFHKWYFSQFVTPESYSKVLKRILIILDFFRLNTLSINRFINNYSKILPIEKETTLFVSFSFDNTSLHPSLKIDLHDLDYRDCIFLPNEEDQLSEQEKLQAFCTHANKKRISYLGVRFFENEDLNLKYYLDLESQIHS